MLLLLVYMRSTEESNREPDNGTTRPKAVKALRTWEKYAKLQSDVDFVIDFGRQAARALREGPLG